MSAPAWAADFVGLPFDWHDRPPGISCWGLVRAVLKVRAGIDLPAYGEVDATALALVAREMNIAAINGPWSEVRVDMARELDVVLMSAFGRNADGRRSRLLAHVGVVVAPALMLNISRAASSHIVGFSHASVVRRIASIWRHEALM